MKCNCKKYNIDTVQSFLTIKIPDCWNNQKQVRERFFGGGEIISFILFYIFPMLNTIVTKYMFTE